MKKENDFQPWQEMEIAEAYAKEAGSLFEDKNYSQALEKISLSIGTSFASDSRHFNKAIVLDSLSRFREAIEEYQHVLENSPNDLETLNCLGIDYVRINQVDLALEFFERIQKLDSQYEPCYCNRIIVYGEIKEYDLAEQMFYLAQQIDLTCSLCYNNMGLNLFNQKKYDQAIRCWLKTLELDPEFPEINYNLAVAFMRTSQTSFPSFVTELKPFSFMVRTANWRR